MKIFLCFSIFLVFSAPVLSQVNNEETVTLRTGSGNLYGVLATPNDKNNLPVALIIPGSGPVDRDGNSPLLPGRNDWMKLLSGHLTDNGFACLRYDKRGYGGSAGGMIPEKELRFEQYVNDVKQWIATLRNDGRFSKIILIGHSQGSLVAMIAAGESEVDGLVSIGGPGSTIDSIIIGQLKRAPDTVQESAVDIIGKIRAGGTVENVPSSLLALFRPSVQPFLHSWMEYDPRQVISKLNMDILIIQGTTDIQVGVEEAQKLATANPGAKLEIIEGMNHVCKNAPADIPQNMEAYADPSLPLNQDFVKKLIGYLNTLLL